MNPRAGIRTSAAALLATGLAACGASAQSTSGTAARSSANAPATIASSPGAPGIARTPCGPAAAEVLARAAGAVATRIYAGELSGSETQSDRSQVEHFAPLLAAVASGERAAVSTAVNSLVFSHTHVVRLLVTRGGVVLADVGGPYILAPVSGTLRFHGRPVGRYVLSVQDDLGYVKLVTRFIGAPLVLRTGSRTVPVEGVLAPGPASIPDHGPVSYRNTTYEAFSFNATAFPSGPLRISLLLPIPRSLAANTCAEINSRELGRVAQRISRRFALAPGNFSAYIEVTRTLTGGLIYIRSGSRQLAGSTRPGPPRLPSEGSVSYRGVSYEVSSFLASTSVGQVRIYQLVAP
ncbi:MAG: hypothetical protein ACHQAV_04380 [Solirubrobacterales bacterium]